MKRDDSEFLRNYYAYFTEEYEELNEDLFMARLYLICSLLANIFLTGITGYALWRMYG